mgnify:CR=1 FL=1
MLLGVTTSPRGWRLQPNSARTLKPPPTMGRATHVRGYAVSRHSPRVHVMPPAVESGRSSPPVTARGWSASRPATVTGATGGRQPVPRLPLSELRSPLNTWRRDEYTDAALPSLLPSVREEQYVPSARPATVGGTPRRVQLGGASDAASPRAPPLTGAYMPPLSARPALHRHHPPPPGSARGDDPMRLRLRRLRAEAAAAERFAAGELVAFEARLAAVHRHTPRSDDPSRRHLPLDPSFADATAATASLRPAFALTALELPRFD